MTATAGSAATPSADELLVALRSIADERITIGCRSIEADDIASLHPDECSAVVRAVDKRRREFASGRALLRELLGTDDAIPVGDDRKPVLPPEFVGSLAHDDRFAVAAVADASSVQAIGIDVEPNSQLSDDMARIILRPDEAALDAHLAFTLKEAVYKAWSCLGGGMLEHHDVRIERAGDGHFDATVVVAEPGQRPCFAGRFAAAGNRIVSLVICDFSQ